MIVPTRSVLAASLSATVLRMVQVLSTGLLAATVSQAQTSDLNVPVLIAGFDFNDQVAATGFYDAEFNVIRFADAIYSDFTRDGARLSTPRARLVFDGSSFSSPEWTGVLESLSSPYALIETSGSHDAPNALIDTYLRTEFSQGSVIPFSVLNVHFNTLTGPDPVNPWFNQTFYAEFTPLGTRSVSFLVDTTGARDLRVTYAVRMKGPSTGTIRWLWSVDGSTPQLVATNTVSGQPYVIRSADFSGIPEVDNRSNVVLIAELSSPTDSFIIDNIQILGTSVAERTRLVPPLPTSSIAAVGGEAVISLNVAGSGLQYQWSGPGSNLFDNGRYSGTQTSALRINPVAAEDYDLLIFVSAVGDIGGAFFGPVRVVQPGPQPTISLQPLPVDAFVGQTAEFIVEARSSGGASEMAFTWQGPLGPLDPASDGVSVSQTVIDPDTVRSTLRLTGLDVSRRGNYSVRVVRPGFTQALSQPAALTVRLPVSLPDIVPPPFFVGVEQSFRPTATGAAAFTYSASGLPDGLTINASTGAITGRALVAGLYTVSVTAVADSFSQASRDYIVEVTFQPVPARIDVQPQSVAVAVGQPATLTATVSGAPEPTLQWFRRVAGVDTAVTSAAGVSGSTTSQLEFAAVTEADAGTYFLRATNNVTVESQLVTLSVLSPATILTQPSSVIALPGQTVTFTVTASGDPAPGFQWTRNGIELPGETGSTLTLANITAANVGSYRVLVNNVIAGVAYTVASDAARLDIASEPSLRGHASLTAVAGEVFSARFLVEGVPAASLTAAGLPAWLTLNPTTATLTGTPSLSNVGSSVIRLTASNAVGSADLDIPLDVLATGSAPVFVVNPQPQVINAGERAELTALATGAPTPVYQWFLNGVAISGANTPILVVPSAQEADLGVYSVSATNASGTALSGNAALGVQSPPAIVTAPVGATLSVGSLLRLTVTATGSEPLTYVWRKSGAILPGANSPTYEVPSVSLADAGAYSVEISNAVGTTRSTAVDVVVGSAPTITLAGSARLVSLGSDLKLEATVDGVPSPTVAWFRNGEPVAGATSASLDVPGIRLAEAGSYTLTAVNAFGESTSVEVPVAVYSPVSLDLPLTASEGAVEFNLPLNFQLELVADADWLSIDSTPTPADTGDGFQVGFEAAGNDSGIAREATITLTLLGAEGEELASKVVPVRQGASEPLPLSFGSGLDLWTLVSGSSHYEIPAAFGGRSDALLVRSGGQLGLDWRSSLTSNGGFRLGADVWVAQDSGGRSSAGIGLAPSRKSAPRRAMDLAFGSTVRSSLLPLVEATLVFEGPVVSGLPAGAAGKGWFRLGYLGADGVRREFDPFQGLDRSRYLGRWSRIEIEADSEGLLRFFADGFLLWAPAVPADPGIFSARQPVVRAVASGSPVAISRFSLVEGDLPRSVDLPGISRFGFGGLASGRETGPEGTFRIAGGSRQLLFRGLGSAAPALGATAPLTDAYLSLTLPRSAFVNQSWTYLGIPGVRDSAAPLAALFGELGLDPYPTRGDNTAGLVVAGSGAGAFEVTGFNGSAGSARMELVATPLTLLDEETLDGRLVAVSARSLLPASAPLSAKLRIEGEGAQRLLLRAPVAATATASRLPTLRLLRNGTQLFANSSVDSAVNAAEIRDIVETLRLPAIASAREAALLVRLDPGDYEVEVLDDSGVSAEVTLLIEEVP